MGAPGRFRPHLEVGGAATGRWGASGGGALQLPAEIRSAIIAPQHQVFTVADGSQIEPRILAALSRDEALAAAGRGVAGHSTDLYEGIAELSRSHGLALTERAQAKVGLLAIMVWGPQRRGWGAAAAYCAAFSARYGVYGAGGAYWRAGRAGHHVFRSHLPCPFRCVAAHGGGSFNGCCGGSGGFCVSCVGPYDP